MAASPSSSTTARRDQSVRTVLWVVLVLNLGVAAAKLTTGWLGNSISMVADGFHSLTDSASNVVGLVAVALAARPPDVSHPYGHRKFETLAAMAVGILLAVAALQVLEAAVRRVATGGEPTAGARSFAVMGVSIVVSLAVSTWERRRGSELDSAVLRADAAHTLSDVYTSVAVILSLVAARLGAPQLDLLAALAITGVIGFAAWQILRDSIAGLSDEALLPGSEVRRVALTVPGVRSVHKIRTRGAGGIAHADLHVQMDPAIRLDQAHRIGHEVADRLRVELGLDDVLAHVEPPAEHRTDWSPGDETTPGETD